MINTQNVLTSDVVANWLCVVLSMKLCELQIQCCCPSKENEKSHFP